MAGIKVRAWLGFGIVVRSMVKVKVRVKSRLRLGVLGLCGVSVGPRAMF